ncbi:hypothetical protein MGN70_009992 [Eutypa lata]|nr:hypothetical protein MGN70_009992 [Eutypa lata]
MANLDLLTATASDLEEALSRGRVTSEDLVSRYLDRIERYNGYLHAIIATPPRDAVLKIARSLDRERGSGAIRGPLHGIPIIIKDNIATDPELGMETTSGTYALVGSRVKHAAPLTEQLRDAGVIIIGKGNLSELSNYRGLRMPCGWSAVGGLTQSPYVVGGKKWDDGFGGHSSTGGSSSGPCVAVAAGLAPISIGTDTNGSILLPATRADVFAMKPTLGLIPQQGICPICLEFDSAGPIARSPRDIALLMDVLVDPSQNAKPDGGYASKITGSFDGIRIGVLDPKEWHLPPIVAVPNSEVYKQQDETIAKAYEALRQAGALVKEVQIEPLSGLEVDGMSQIGRVMSKLEGAAEFSLSAAERRKAIEDMRDFGRRRAIDKCLEEYGVDVIIGPADSEIDDYYSAAGYPMAVMPLSYFDFNKRPFGVCALASRNQEGVLIQLMSAWAKMLKCERRLPTWLNGDPGGRKEED